MGGVAALALCVALSVTVVWRTRAARAKPHSGHAAALTHSGHAAALTAKVTANPLSKVREAPDLTTPARVWRRVTDGDETWLVNDVTGASAWEGNVPEDEIIDDAKRPWRRVTDGDETWLLNDETGATAWEGTVPEEEIAD